VVAPSGGIAGMSPPSSTNNPLAFRWDDQPFEIRSILLIDIGETMENSPFQVPLFTYRNFPRREGMTVEQALASLGWGVTADMGVQIPETLIDDCVRWCCSLCLLENAPWVIELDVLSKDHNKFEASGDERYVDKFVTRTSLGVSATFSGTIPRMVGEGETSSADVCWI